MCYIIASTHGSKHSKSTMMLFKQGFDISIVSVNIDIKGRSFIIDTIIQGENHTLVNIYVPNAMHNNQLL